MISFRSWFVSLILLAFASFSPSTCQKTPPSLPEEFACNVIQKKWNANGNNVNHTYSGIWYSSYSRQMIRSDGVFYDGNHTNTVTSYGTQISLLDFSNDPSGINYYFEKNSLSDTGSCYEGPVTGFFAPPSSSFLSDIGATFAGYDYSIDYGQCEKWSFFLSQIEIGNKYLNNNFGNSTISTLMTFWFDKNNAFVRWDLLSNGLNTGVQTFHSNCNHNLVFDDEIFSSKCKT